MMAQRQFDNHLYSSTQEKKSAPVTNRHSTLFPNNRIESIIEDVKNSQYVNNLSKETL